MGIQGYLLTLCKALGVFRIVRPPPSDANVACYRFHKQGRYALGWENYNKIAFLLCNFHWWKSENVKKCEFHLAAPVPRAVKYVIQKTLNLEVATRYWL